MIKLRAFQWAALGAYVIAGEALALATAGSWPGVIHAARPVLMPLLAVVLLSARPEPRDRWVMVGGLALATAADLTLLQSSPHARATATVLLLGAYLAYLVALIRGGAYDGLRAMPGIPAAYTLILIVVLAVRWDGLGHARLLAVGYGLVLAAMAACAATFGAVIGLGGGLLVLAQTLAAFGVAQAHAGGAATIALAYTAGQALVAVGWTRVQVREPATSPTPARVSDQGARSI